MSPVTALLAGTVVPPASAPSPARHARHYSVGFSPLHGGGRAALAVECSSRPQKKGTKHHMKTRPKKTQPWDIKRRPTQYPPLPPPRRRTGRSSPPAPRWTWRRRRPRHPPRLSSSTWPRPPTEAAAACRQSCSLEPPHKLFFFEIYYIITMAAQIL
ncbi:50S ribosomal protein 6, chloroplastic [Zea mays]|uniref:50S ribosomal protein 6, chloroplastic n=1 Tax=Zea mays TaxID=4577 RepID=A0A3L6D6W5_MAIZE|nr:50S ribosomal protein 6, chloroplastic [Zea mays]